MANISAVKEITDKLEAGMNELFESEKYAAYLQTMSRFHRYSTRNTLLIHMQRPSATRVAGYNDWQNNFKRQVKKGEKGIRILAPIPFVKREELDRIDPVTKRPIIGMDGQPVREEVEIRLARFKVVPVFDIEQTEGEPLPELAEILTGDVARFELFMDALRAVSPLPMVFEAMPPDTDGICHFGDRIAIRNGMSEVQTVSAVIHEITHAKLHDLQVVTENDGTPKDRRTEEVEAESVSYAVCQYYGIDTGANSFGYIAEWSRGRELKELNASLDTIRKTAAELIGGIDEQYHSLAKARGIDLTVSASSLEGQVALSEVVSAAKVDASTLIAEYARLAEVSEKRTVGRNVLLMPVFDGGNFNRNGTRIRVTVEEPVGKYQIFSREESEQKAFYFLTASGLIDKTSGYFRDEWNEETHKWEHCLPSEAEMDEIIPKIAEQFELDMADPTKWARYQHAAVVNRIADCEAHNVPVRKQREVESQRRQAEAERARQEAERVEREKYDARVDEIAASIGAGTTISVAYNENDYYGKNPVLDLFKLYGINLPLRTQGWVNTGLAEITDGSYRYYKSKHKGNSTTFGSYLHKLREAIRETPIEQKRGVSTPAQETEVKGGMEYTLYNKLTELFPGFMDRKYSYMRLESQGFEPLSLEWIGDNRISIMHTYELNGDLCYDPMATFYIDSDARTATAHEFEQSLPPLYQRVTEENGEGASIDGNGNERTIKNLRAQINSFAAQWFQNIGEQGYMPVKADLVLGEDKTVRITFDKNGDPIMPEPEKPAPLPDPTLPDPSITSDEMRNYGYTQDEMHPLTAERAAELFDSDHTIYLLYPDNTEAMAFDRDEIIAFGNVGICGIEKADWERSPVYAAQAALSDAVSSHESDLLFGGEDKLGIYQLKPGDETRYHRFESLDSLQKHGLSVDRKNYELIYTAPLTDKDTLDGIYERFNLNRPSDFTGHSLSVGDIIVMKRDGEVSSHYVDDFGFSELPVFTGNERKQPQAASLSAPSYSQVGNSSPTVAKQQPPASKGKPSLLGKLEDNKRKVAQQGQHEQRKPDGLEV